jgi:hypothetical protein
MQASTPAFFYYSIYWYTLPYACLFILIYFSRISTCTYAIKNALGMYQGCQEQNTSLQNLKTKHMQ